MGGNQSINQTNVQTVSNKISQVSNEQCLNLCLNEGDINIKIIDSDVGNITIQKGCAINSSSCVLKAALDTDLINDLSSSQDSRQTELQGPFTVLTELLGGGNQTVNQNNYQAISNESSQQMNSLCRTSAISSNPIVVDIEQSKVKNLNIDNMDQINKSQCVIDNMSKFYAQNSESNSQSAHQTQAGLLSLIIIAIVIIAVVFLATRHRHHILRDLAILVSKSTKGAKELLNKNKNKNNVTASGQAQNVKKPVPAQTPAQAPAPPRENEGINLNTLLGL